MTDPIEAAKTAPPRVSAALSRASEKTGVDFNYLYRVAMRESSLNPGAKAATSSAAGLFQFIEQTWLGAVKKYGAAHGLGAEARQIIESGEGRFTVADPARRQAILNLRFDPEKAASLAGELARENKKALETSLGRAVEAAELYAAHFLGPAGAKKLLGASPEASAASLLPAAAKANRHVFYDGARARTVGEVLDSFRRTIGGVRTAVAALGERVEKALAPFMREFGAAHAPERAAQERSAFEAKGLSALALIVLQALDSPDFIRDSRRDDARERF